ncbi:DUF4023 domain-containing protein [Bacillus sp. HMF5848]|nr:DUF4023 domain-containing protein [Bacillus sp. HMF5848]RSK29081.1 DUF4023 domain-containing protein [Bacillus sp. HMF5848]
MESTHEFVEKIHDTQKKDEKNREHQGKHNPNQKLPNKQHSQGV